MPEQRTRRARRTTRGNGASADDVATLASGAKQSASELGAGDPAETLDSASEAVNDATGAARQTVHGELGSIARDAAIEVLGPVVRNATTQAAKYAVRKGPQLAVKRVGPMFINAVGPAIEEAGGPAALARGALSSVSGGGAGLLSRLRLGRGDGDERESARIGRGRKVPVEEAVDIGAPIEVVYDKFTQFEDFTNFIFGAEDVEQTDDTHLVWIEKIWGIRRKLEVEITDLEPNARIAWKSETGTESTGAITFHRLDERLTRVLVTRDVQPHGLLERSASGFGLSRRSLKSDLIRFKAFIELREDEEGAGATGVEDGEVVDGGETQPTRATKASKPTRATSKRAKPAGADRVEDAEVVEDGEVVNGGETQPTRSTKASKPTRATSKRAKPARRRRRAPEPEPEPEPDDEYDDVEAYEEEDEPEAFEEEQDEAFEEDEPEAFDDEDDEVEDEEEEPKEPVRRRPIRRRAPARPSRGR